MAELQDNPASARARYSKLETKRRQFLERARMAAKLSIPTLLPPEGHDGTQDLPTPFQSLAARGVNNLSSKLLMTLLPTNHSFFRADPTPEVKQELDQDEKLEREVSAALAIFEDRVMREVDSVGDRVPAFELFKHLIVAGNILVFNHKEGLKLFSLDKYVVRRDGMGKVLEIIVKEMFHPESLPDPVKAIAGESGDISEGKEQVAVYTVIRRNPENPTQYGIWQEASDQEVPGTFHTQPADKLEWLPLRMIRVDSEDYGRSFVEEYLGDIQSLEGLTKAVVEGAAAASKVLFLVRPNSTTKIKTLTKAPNGGFATGSQDDISTLQVDKFNDFRVVLELIRDLTERLSLAFLLNTAVQRDAERVTAEEIRFIAEELEGGLGGVYSILTEEFQRPYAEQKIAVLRKRGALPELSKELVRITIVTGLEALGRGQERDKIIRFARVMAETFGPQALGQLNVRALMERFAIADGLDVKDMFKSEDQIAAEQQQAQMAELLSKSAPELVRQGGTALREAAAPTTQGVSTDGQ